MSDPGATTPNGDLTLVGEECLPYQVIVLASAARTADPVANTDKGFPLPQGANAIDVRIVATAKSSTPSVVFNLEGYDKASGTWYLILASAAITDAGSATLTVWPGAPTTSNVSANAVLPEKIRVRPVHADTDSLTYSVGATFTRT